MSKDPKKAQPGTVYLVGAGPGDPGLLTVRGRDLLSSADVVLHDELVHPTLLRAVKPGAEVRSVGKRGGDSVSKEASQRAIDAELQALGRSGKSVVRLKGGDPFLFGRGSEEADALVRAGVPFEVVPGIPSPLGAAAYAGISLTHRDLASSVTFVSATTREGAFPFGQLASLQGTICVLMGMRNLEDVVSRLMGEGRRDPSTPAAVVEWGTRPEQRVVAGRLDAIVGLSTAAGLGSPAVVIVGPVVSLRSTLRWFDARPLFAKRVLVLRAEPQAFGTAASLLGRGAVPIEMAALTIGDAPDPARVERAVRELGGYESVAFTSENGVERFFAVIDRLGLDARVFGPSRVAAIGTGTAAALLRHGLRADVVPSDFRGEALADAILADFGARGTKTGRVLVPRALVAREVLPERLRAAGFEVDVVPVYETHRAGPERGRELRKLLEKRGIDAVLLTSSSTADGLCELLGPTAKAALAGVPLASIGPVTTQTAVGRGLSVAVTASESTLEGLLDGLERYFASSAEKPGESPGF